MSLVHESWQPLLQREQAEPYFAGVRLRVLADRASGPVYPPRGTCMDALQTPLPAVRAVILGQDPYHGAGQAHGLAFSVPVGVKAPPSLKNVLDEWHDDVGRHYPAPRQVPSPRPTDLTPWAQRGVLLLNTVLTVKAGKPKSHAGVGWETFSDAVCRAVLAQDRPVAWLLWGADARKKLAALTGGRFTNSAPAGSRMVSEWSLPGNSEPHLFLTAPHPSPLAPAGFSGYQHFSRCNAWLRSRGVGGVDWSLAPSTGGP